MPHVLLPVLTALLGLCAGAAITLILLALSRRRKQNSARGPDGAARDLRSAPAGVPTEDLLSGQGAAIIENVIQLRDVTVSAIMTPRPDIACVDLNEPFDQALRTALNSGHSRVPVFRNTRDDIVGVLHVRDLAAALLPKDAQHSATIESLMRPAYFVPETMRISRLLGQFQRRATTLAIVADEYGGTAGLVTVRDIINLVVGEIRDQSESRREPVIHVIDRHNLEAEARTPVRKLNESFAADIPENDQYVSVGGYLCYTLGRVPRAGDRLSAGRAELLVLHADERRALSVRITTRPPPQNTWCRGAAAKVDSG